MERGIVSAGRYKVTGKSGAPKLETSFDHSKMCIHLPIWITWLMQIISEEREK